MFCIWVTLRIDPARRSEFLAAITEDAVCSVRDEPGCIGFDIIELDEQQGRYALYERYVDETAFSQDHQQSPHYAVYRAVAQDLILEQDAQRGTVLVDQHQ